MGMSTRTRRGSLELIDTFDQDRSMIIDGSMNTAIGFLTVDRDSDQRAIIYLSGSDLDELAAEIARIRAERDI